MGYRDFGSFDGEINEAGSSASPKTITLDGAEQSVPLPDSSYIKNSSFSKDGMDLVLDHADGQIIVENYYAQAEPPTLVSPDGTSLSPALVNSFMTSDPLYANAGSESDESPVGAVHEISGDATITRTDGTTEPMKLGTPVYQGDIIETSGDGAVNIMFIDETSLAVSEDARMAIDEYVFDPSSSAGVSNFSVLKGVFVYTSGLIGREDPDDVQIETPVGSIGIRGTIIAADVDQGEVTVVEGAIVLTDMAGNSMTLATQFETARFNSAGGSIENMGQLSANDVTGKYSAVSGVSGQLFSSIADSAAQEQPAQTNEDAQPTEQQDSQSNQSIDQNSDNNVDGTVDQNGDGGADGTVGEPIAADGDQSDATDALTGEPATEGAAEPVIQTATTFTDSKFGTTNTLGTNTGSTSPTASTATTSSSATTATSAPGASAPTSPGPASTQNIKSALIDSKNIDTLNPDIKAITGKAPDIVTNGFDFNISSTPVAEHLSGANVALINSVNGALGTITLNGPYQSLFEFQRIDANSGYIRLRSGEDLDFETFSQMNLGVTSTNGAGTSSVSKGFVVNVQNVNEAPYVYEQASDMMFTATENTMWNYNFRAEFMDEDIGDTMTFSFQIQDEFGALLFDSANPVTTAEALLIGANTVSFANGNMNINFGTTILTSSFTIEVTATDGGGLTQTSSYDFDTISQSNTLAGTDTAFNIVSSGNVYSSVLGGSNIFIDGAANQLFFSNVANLNINLNDGSNSNNIYLMNGNDEINILAGSYENYVSGGNGNDIFRISSGENYIYGEEGADRFVLDTTTETLVEMGIDGGLINGGADGANTFFVNFDTIARNGVAARSVRIGGDALEFGAGTYNDLDFSGVNGLISNIEILDFTNNQSNSISLSYNDVFSMTDDRDTLIIKGDAGDTLEFDTNGENVFDGGEITDQATGDSYDLYFVDGITLLIDADIAVTTV